MKYGQERVETFLDAVLAVQEHIDPSLTGRQFDWKMDEEHSFEEKSPRPSQYNDLWKLEEISKVKNEEEEQQETTLNRRIPYQPEKDLLLFIEEFSPILEEWQRDVLTIMREEMLYFWPQIETKIMNEGWATFWHQRIIREMDLTEEETIEFAKLNSGVIQPSTTSINPYYLGVKMLEDIERRWDQPTEEEQKKFGRKFGKGREKIFEVRETDNDISFIRNYLTKELVEETDMYVFAKQGNDWAITEKTWELVRNQLVTGKINGGFPFLLVKDGNYLKNGELYLYHQFENIELDIKYLEKTIPYIYTLWGKTVHLETIIEQRKVLFTYDGKKCHRRFL